MFNRAASTTIDLIVGSGDALIMSQPLSFRMCVRVTKGYATPMTCVHADSATLHERDIGGLTVDST